MAPIIEPVLIEIFPWPLFTAVLDGQPAIGAKLYGFVPGTSTPKRTFADPFMTVPNDQPVVLNDQGEATVYLDGLYDLRLYSAEDALVWQVESYTFSSGVSPSPGAVQVGTSQITLTALDGARVLTAATLVPVGYRLLGLRTAITADFGTSRGLQSLLIGDAVVNDRWGRQTTLTAVTGTEQQHFHAADCPISSGTGYAILIAAAGGRFDSQGAILLTAHWERLLETATGDLSTGVDTGSASVTVHASDGARQLTVGGLVPLGARVLGIVVAITTSFGTTRGLSALLIGDAVVNDRFGRTTALTASAVTSQGQFRTADCPISATPYTLLVAADGGRFDGQGALQVTAYWSTLTA